MLGIKRATLKAWLDGADPPQKCMLARLAGFLSASAICNACKVRKERREGSVVYFALYDWFDVDDRGAVDGFE